eukprot:gene13200-biopygen15561
METIQHMQSEISDFLDPGLARLRPPPFSLCPNQEVLLQSSQALAGSEPLGKLELAQKCHCVCTVQHSAVQGWVMPVVVVYGGGPVGR